VIRDSEFLLGGPFAQAALTSFFFMSSLNCFILLPLYIHRLGGTEAEIGIVQGAYSAIGILCQPVVGLWLDRVGRRAFMILGVVLLMVSSASFIFTQSLPVLALLRVLQGLGFSTFFVANYVHVVGLVPVERRGWALGIYGLSGFLGTALAPVAGEIVVNNLGFRWLFLLAVLLSGVAALLVARTHGIHPPDMGRGPGFEIFREALKDVLRVHMALAFFFGLGIGAMFTFLPTFGESLGVRSVALYYTAYAVAAMGVRVAGGNLIDTQGRRATIIPSMFIQAASVAILALLALQVRPHMAVPIVPFLVLAGLLAGGGHGFLYRALSALLMDVTPERHRGGAVGIFSGVMLIGQTLGSMIFGYVAHGFGYAVMWGVVTLLLTAGFVLSHWLREGRAARVPVAG
jgi:MFS family permease